VLIALGIGLAFVLVALGTIKELSPTFDEPVHVLAGYSYLKWRDYRVNPEHPPLAKALAALPLLAVDIKDPRPGNLDWDRIPKQQPGIPTVKVARELLFVHNDGATLFQYAKLPFVILTVVLGLFVFLWSLQWFGPVAAVASLVLFAADPNITAHSTLVHTDMAFTTFFLSAAISFNVRFIDSVGRTGYLPALFFPWQQSQNFLPLDLCELEPCRFHLAASTGFVAACTGSRCRYPKSQTAPAFRNIIRKPAQCVFIYLGGLWLSIYGNTRNCSGIFHGTSYAGNYTATCAESRLIDDSVSSNARGLDLWRASYLDVS
jgi:hypothetical protein